MSEEMDLEELWEQVREALFAEDTTRSVWDAARKARPLALEDDRLVLGFAPEDMHYASYLTSTLNRPKVQNAVEAVLGRRVGIHTVEGATVQAWEGEKERQARREEVVASQLRERTAKAGTTEIWQHLYEEIGRTFRGVRDRRFPMNRAKMVGAALKQIKDSEQRARTDDPEGTEIHDKEINRAIDRIAVLAELPPTVVAIEYLRMRGGKATDPSQ